MSSLPAPISPDRWLGQLFGARIAAEGGIVRRKVTDVERLVGRRRFCMKWTGAAIISWKMPGNS